MYDKRGTIGPEPLDEDIEMEMRDLETRNPELAQIMRKLIKERRIEDSGNRKFQNGRWQIVWVPAEGAKKSPMEA
jgi:hypothetical protein